MIELSSKQKELLLSLITKEKARLRRFKSTQEGTKTQQGFNQIVKIYDSNKLILELYEIEKIIKEK